MSQFPDGTPKSTRVRNEAGNFEHLKGLEDFAEIREVARRYDDDRGRRFCDIFDIVTGDINITHAYPRVITAWHAHKRQYDEWFVIKAALKDGLAIPTRPGKFQVLIVHLSKYDRKMLP